MSSVCGNCGGALKTAAVFCSGCGAKVKSLSLAESQTFHAKSEASNQPRPDLNFQEAQAMWQRPKPKGSSPVEREYTQPPYSSPPQTFWPQADTRPYDPPSTAPVKSVSTLQIVAGALLSAVVTLVVVLWFFLGRSTPAETQAKSAAAAATVASPTVTPESFSAFIVTQQGGNLNVRSQPQQNSLPLAKLPHGAPVVVTGSVLMADGLWRQVNVAGVIGYVKGDYISQTQPGAVVSILEAPMMQIGVWGAAVTQRSATVNMRASPSSNGLIISSIPYGASVYIIGQQGSWYFIEYGGRRGWANTGYIQRY